MKQAQNNIWPEIIVTQARDNIWPEIVVKQARDNIRLEIVKSFKKCCISNVLNGTEDYALFNDYDSCIENEYQSFDNEDDEFYDFKDE